MVIVVIAENITIRQLIELIVDFSTIKRLIVDNCFDSKLTNCYCFFILATINYSTKITIKLTINC